MLSDKAKAALLDIRDNILLAQQFAQGLSPQEFAASRLHFYAATRSLEIVSEAARRLPESFRAKHSELPWKKIMGVGNIYRHGYDNVQETFVWFELFKTTSPHCSRSSSLKFSPSRRLTVSAVRTGLRRLLCWHGTKRTRPRWCRSFAKPCGLWCSGSRVFWHHSEMTRRAPSPLAGEGVVCVSKRRMRGRANRGDVADVAHFAEPCRAPCAARGTRNSGLAPKMPRSAQPLIRPLLTQAAPCNSDM